MAYRDRYSLEPLRIRANLRTGVVCDKWLPLDGILLYQAHRMEVGHGPEATMPGEYTAQSVPTLPLGMVHSGQRNWYYQCSWAQWSHDIESQDYWNKRFDSRFADLIDFQGKRGNITVKSGKYKAYRMPIFYRVALWVEWYCVGDKAVIEQLLSTLTHIGKKSVQGWGRVLKWEVESIGDDWSVWRDGKLMRGIPKEDIDAVTQFSDKPIDFRFGAYGIRPSYWKKSNQRNLALPI